MIDAVGARISLSNIKLDVLLRLPSLAELKDRLNKKWLEQSNIFTSTCFSSAQISFILKFLLNFCDKIRRYSFSKIQNAGGTELSEENI